MDFIIKFNITDQHIPVRFENVQTATEMVGGDVYAGPLEVTPSTTEQTLPTSGKVLAENVTIKPIPKEYGLVTYDNRKIITIT